MEEKNKTVAALLAIFLGAFGAHFFYLGDSKKGTTRLLLSIFIPLCAFIFGIMGIVDGIKILSMSDDAFETYCYDMTAEKEEESDAPIPPVREDGDAKEPTDETAKAPTKVKRVVNAPVDYAERFNLLRVYKDLLDRGAITEREFGVIKIRIMGWNHE